MGAAARGARGHPEEVLLHLLPALYASRQSAAHVLGTVVALCVSLQPLRGKAAAGLRAAGAGGAAGALLPLALLPAAPAHAGPLVGAAAAALALSSGLPRGRAAAIAAAAALAAAGPAAAAVPPAAALAVLCAPGAFSAPEAALVAAGAVAALRAAAAARAPAPVPAAGAASALALAGALAAAALPRRGGGNALALCAAGALAYGLAWARALRAEPVLWTVRHVAGSRARGWLTAGWAVALCGCAALPARCAAAVGRVEARKLFHLLATALFLPALAADPGFLAFASAGALGALTAAEGARAARLPGANALDALARPLLDERDAAAVRVTHLYLLAGCTAPVWLRPRFDLQAAAGLVTLGVLDAVAAAAGRRFGRTKWPRGAGRTVEGSAAGIVAGVAFCAAVCWAAGEGPGAFAKGVVATVLSGLLEAHSTQIDNLVLPLYFYAVIDMLKT